MLHYQLADAIAARNDQIAECMAEAARIYGGGGALSEAKYNFWVRTFEHLHPVPGQRRDSAMTDIVITKGASKLTKDDWKLAKRMAKEKGMSLEKALWAIEQVNDLNTPSYQGGSLLEKGGELLQKKVTNAKRAARFVLEHKMTGAQPDVDAAIFKALYSARQPLGRRPGEPVTSALGLLVQSHR
jgi:hypothetical protein